MAASTIEGMSKDAFLGQSTCLWLQYLSLCYTFFDEKLTVLQPAPDESLRSFATQILSSAKSSDHREPRIIAMVAWAFTHRAWEKWASNNIGSSGEPLKAALLLNYDPSGPSRLMSVIAEQQGIKLKPVDLGPFLDFIRRNNLQTEYFSIGANEYLVTSIHEQWFCARCVNTSKPAGEGAIVMQTPAFLLVAMYEGSIGSASRAMMTVDQFAWQLSRLNL